MRWVLAAGLLLGCSGADKDGGLMDTGWFEPWEEDVGADCAAQVIASVPEHAETGWYWRDAPRVFTGAPSDVYAARLTDALGQEVPTTLDVTEDGLSFHVRFEGGLAPSTEHALELTDCRGPSEVRFTTSAAGTPLEEGPDDLIGRTYKLELNQAEWLQPAGFGAILASQFDTPILVGVQWADDEIVDMLGAQGWVYLGETYQVSSEPTWDFPVTSFDDTPYFRIEADQVEVSIGGFPLPISRFVLSGTFEPGAQNFTGGTLAGIGDSRLAGGAIGQAGNEAAICNLSGGLGVPCIECADGEPFCLEVEIVGVTGEGQDGLTLVRVDAD